MSAVNKPCLLLVLVALIKISQCVEYNHFDVSISDNNRGGGIQVNLPKSGSNYFEPTESYEPDQATTYNFNTKNRRFGQEGQPRKNNGFGQSEYDENDFQSNTPSRSGSTNFDSGRTNTQIIGADGSVIQTIRRQEYPGGEPKILTQVTGADGSVYQTIKRGGSGPAPSGGFEPNENEAPSQGTVHNVETYPTTPREQSANGQAPSASQFGDPNKWKTIRVRLNNAIKTCYCPVKH